MKFLLIQWGLLGNLKAEGQESFEQNNCRENERKNRKRRMGKGVIRKLGEEKRKEEKVFIFFIFLLCSLVDPLPFGY